MTKRKPRTLYIKNPAAHRLAEKVSKKMGVTLTEAVIRALEEQLRNPPRAIDWKKVDAITREIAAMPVLDSRSMDEILGYDEFGLPIGKGTGHPAQLNFGDCAVYALAALHGEPVLATGADFKATDLMAVPF